MWFFKNLFDERFILHRLKATRFATIVTAIAMAVYINYDIFVSKTIHWDLLCFLGILVVSKLGATVYYRLTN